MDILLDDNFNFRIENGDFVVGDDKEQRALLILDSHQGHWKQWAAVGVGINSMLNGNLTRQLNRRIRLQLQSDGLNLQSTDFSNGNLEINLR